MDKPLNEKIVPAEVFSLQNQQYSERLLMTDFVLAGQTKLGRTAVSNLGHFYCQFITGTYTTIASPLAAIVDTGINYLSGQLIDGAGNRKLFSDRIPFPLWLSPGRRKDATSTTWATDPVPTNFIIPLEMDYLFTANSDILLEVVNNSDETNFYEIEFWGVRVLATDLMAKGLGKMRV